MTKPNKKDDATGSISGALSAITTKDERIAKSRLTEHRKTNKLLERIADALGGNDKSVMATLVENYVINNSPIQFGTVNDKNHFDKFYGEILASIGRYADETNGRHNDGVKELIRSLIEMGY